MRRRVKFPLNVRLFSKQGAEPGKIKVEAKHHTKKGKHEHGAKGKRRPTLKATKTNSGVGGKGASPLRGLQNQ